MSQRPLRTSAHERGFLADARNETRLFDLALITAVPVLLIAVFAFPRSTLQQLVFDTTAPSVVTAYTSHFVHLNQFHLLGNLTVYVPAVAIGYLLSILGNRRQLFVTTFVVLLFIFPFALSAMQLIFPRQRLLFGFSGINAGFVGLACFALAGYFGTNISRRAGERYAPTLFFFSVGMVALVSLPAGAFRLLNAGAALTLATIYLANALYRQGVPTRDDVRSAVSRPGYFEAAGAGFGLLVGYPFVAFQDAVVPESGVLDIYVHLLGFSLAFIIMFSYVAVLNRQEEV